MSETESDVRTVYDLEEYLDAAAIANEGDAIIFNESDRPANELERQLAKDFQKLTPERMERLIEELKAEVQDDV